MRTLACVALLSIGLSNLGCGTTTPAPDGGPSLLDAGSDDAGSDDAGPVDTGPAAARDLGRPDLGPEADLGPAMRRDMGPRADGGATPSGGCNGATLLPRPADPSVFGPWPVGVRTATVGRLTMEVWYPATVGSDANLPPAVYDIRQWLPPSQQRIIPVTDAPPQVCDCTRDLPVDAGNGPYPLVVFVHGTAAFRTQSLELMTHLASRGFVVVAVDHPGLFLGDLLTQVACFRDPRPGARDLSRDVDAELAAVTAASGELAFLAGRVDTTRVALVGHSAGGAVAEMTGKPGVQVVVSLAGATPVTPAATLRASLFMAATTDAVVPFMTSRNAYTTAPAPKRFVAISNAGHLFPSSLCDIANRQGETILMVAQRYEICGADLASALFDCLPTYITPPTGRTITNDVVAATLEDVLQCTPRQDALATISTRHPAVTTNELVTN